MPRYFLNGVEICPYCRVRTVDDQENESCEPCHEFMNRSPSPSISEHNAFYEDLNQIIERNRLDSLPMPEDPAVRLSDDQMMVCDQLNDLMGQYDQDHVKQWILAMYTSVIRSEAMIPLVQRHMSELRRTAEITIALTVERRSQLRAPFIESVWDQDPTPTTSGALTQTSPANPPIDMELWESQVGNERPTTAPPTYAECLSQNRYASPSSLRFELGPTEIRPDGTLRIEKVLFEIPLGASEESPVLRTILEKFSELIAIIDRRSEPSATANSNSSTPSTS